MFLLAILIGLYSYIIFFLGITGLLFKNLVLFVSLVYIAFILIFFRKKIINLLNSVKKFIIPKNKITLFLSTLIITQLLINFIGVLGPELGFDALWYHLTLPKLYLVNHAITHIPGSLLYYSDMPKLTEMLYTASLSIGNEILAKLIHFLFGILSLLAIYKLAGKFVSQKFAILAALIFYSNLVVGWESITAYIDLTRTFFEILAFWAFLNWTENNKKKWIIISGTMLGLALTSKVIALESAFIFMGLFIYAFWVKKEKIINLIKNIFLFCFFSILIPLPWLIFAFINTSNPFYPFFSKSINVGTDFNLPNFSNIVKDLLNLFIYANDPISPIYLIVLPILVIFFIKAKKEFKIMYIYSFLGLVLWYFTPKIGGGRFILAYLPAFSILAAYAISTLKDARLKNFLLIIIVFISFTSIGYRALANKKYIPVILGKETKAQYLTKHLNFSFGDFYDTDGYFQKNIKTSDKVLLYGFHNLYYIDFNFIDSSWVKRGDTFNYIAVQNGKLPEKYNFWQEIYYNPITNVKLYSLEGQKWAY